jgi:hypothetical protein
MVQPGAVAGGQDCVCTDYVRLLLCAAAAVEDGNVVLCQHDAQLCWGSCTAADVVPRLLLVIVKRPAAAGCAPSAAAACWWWPHGLEHIEVALP